MRAVSRRLGRGGFTLIETLMAVAIGGILCIIAFPHVGSALDAAALRSAKQSVAAQLAQTRAVAIHLGHTAHLVRTSNSLQTTVDTGTVSTNVGPAQDVYQLHGVTVTATSDTITFDARGLAVGLGGSAKLYLTRSGRRDSVCVIGLGKISAVGCTL